MLKLPEIDYQSRLARMRDLINLESGDAVYISALPNIRYFSGFSGSAGVMLLTVDAAILITDQRYEESARIECETSRVNIVGIPSASQFGEIARLLMGVRRLVVDPSQISMEDYWHLKDSVPTAELVHRRGSSEKLRLTKDTAEVVRIREACRIALKAFADVHAQLEVESTERSIANRLEARIKELGAEDIAFATIVASGPNSAKPHVRPSEQVVREGQPVIIDFGAVVDGYHSDITRTIWFGDLARDLRPIYEAAKDAHSAGITSMRAGVTHAAVDAVCREVFVSHGFIDKPLHPSGHNVGLSIHERPFLTPYSTEPILEGYVLTVEPGLYIPTKGGCRIEDTVLVGAEGVEVLSQL